MSLVRSTNWTSGSAWRWCLGVAFALLAERAAYCQPSHGVRVRASGPEQVTARPGSIVSAGFTITSSIQTQEQFLETLSLPPGWQTITPLSDFPLPAGASESRLVAFAVPRTAEARSYTLTYAVRGRHDLAVQDKADLFVTVIGVSKIEALAETRLLTVVAGSAWETRVQVVNRGNRAVQLRAAAEVSGERSASVEPAEFSLLPGGQQTVVVKGTIPQSEPRSVVVSVPVRFEALGGDGEGAVAEVDLALDVIARQAGEVDLARQLPTKLALRLTGGDGGDSLQAQWSGEGFVDDEGKRKVEFLVRAPGAEDDSVFGLSSDAHLTYSTPDLELALGDQTYALSYLTESLGYGRGVSLHLGATGSDETTLYHYQSTAHGGPSRQSGLRYQRQVGERWLAAANILVKAADDDGLASPSNEGRIGSFELALRPARDVQARLEYGLSQSDGFGRDAAYNVEVRGKLGRDGTYSLHKLRAGADYAGYVRDVDLTVASLSLTPVARLRISGSVSEYERNLERRSQAGSAPLERLWRVGADYALSGGWSAGLTYDHYRRDDAMGAATAAMEEEALRLIVARSAEEYNLRAALSHRTRRDLSSGAVSRPWALDLMALYRHGSRCAISAFGGLGQDTGLDASSALGLNRHAGVSLDWQARPDLSCSLWYTDQRPAAIFNSDSVQAQLLLSYHPASGRTWEVQLRRSAYGDGPAEISYALTYVIPFALPVGRRRDLGILSGRVFDAQSPARSGVAGAVVIVDGQAVCTGAEGQFTVGGLAPGKHHLQIDHASIGLERVTTEPMPVVVEVAGGATVRMEVGITVAAAVEGVVTIRAAARTAGEAPVVGAPRSPGSSGEASAGGLLVELCSDTDKRECLSDADGRYRFEGLRPGAWRLRVNPATLPAQHCAVETETTVSLQPGQRCQTLIEVVERPRRIRMLDSGSSETLISAP